MRAVVGWLLAGVLWAGCPKKEARPTSNGAPSGSAILLSGDMRGYLGPCGCSENMRGGLPRAAAQVELARKEASVLFFDGGDSLFRQEKLPPESVPQERRKAQAISELWKKMGLAARALGERDEALGSDFRRSLGLPELSPGVPKLLTLGAHPIAVVAASSGEQLQEGARKARGQGAAFVLALWHGNPESARAAATSELGVDLMLASHADTELSGEENRLFTGAVPIVQVQSKGRSLARVDLSWNGPSGARFEPVQSSEDSRKAIASLDERIDLLRKEMNEPGLSDALKTLKQQKAAELVTRREALASGPVAVPAGKNVFSVRFIPLESSLPSDAAAQSVVTDYDRDVGQLNLAYAKEHGVDCPKPAKNEAAFVGNASCKECHSESFAVWESSKHAHAFETLVSKGKQYHLDCIGCHVTGMNKPGGVCRIDRVDGRKDVGCESCHGPGSLHADEPTSKNIVSRVTEGHCRGCHDPENSPHFDFALYLPKILGPGHGSK